MKSTCKCIKKLNVPNWNKKSILVDEILEYDTFIELPDQYNKYKSEMKWIIYFGFSGNRIMTEKEFHKHFMDTDNLLSTEEYLDKIIENMN